MILPVIRPIFGLPLIGGHVSLSAEIIKRGPRAVLLSNGTTEMWLPLSQLVRVEKNQVVVTAWIARQKQPFISMLKNESPQYAEWLVMDQAERQNAAEWIRQSGGFQCKMDHGD